MDGVCCGIYAKIGKHVSATAMLPTNCYWKIVETQHQLSYNENREPRYVTLRGTYVGAFDVANFDTRRARHIYEKNTVTNQV